MLLDKVITPVTAKKSNCTFLLAKLFSLELSRIDPNR